MWHVSHPVVEASDELQSVVMAALTHALNQLTAAVSD